MDSVVQLIRDVGFPIAACIFMAYYINKHETQHHEDMVNITNALNNNTTAINLLIDRSEKDEDND